MRPLSPAASEFRVSGSALLACGLALGAGGIAAGDAPAAAGIGLAAALLAIWIAGGARALRRALRLALPVPPRWALETTGRTLARVAWAQVVPAALAAAAAGTLLHDRLPGAPAFAGGALAAAGAAGLVGAARVRRAERALGRRVLRAPGIGAPIGRRSLYLEPLSPADGPGDRRVSPWSAHRPPAPRQGSAMELEPANGAARHAPGVRVPRLPPGIGPRPR